jgi:hypothetical protein
MNGEHGSGNGLFEGLCLQRPRENTGNFYQGS